MAVADIHPSLAELEAFALGKLADSSPNDVETHVAGCRVCQERAASTAGDTLIGLLRRVHSQTSPHEDTRTQGTQAPTTAQGRRPVADAEANTLAHTETMEVPGDQSGHQVPEELAHHERYQVVRLLGAGGMGSVYEAKHCVMERTVALKVINAAFTSRPDTVERFRREVRAAARLSHPNIVTTFDAEDAGTTLFLVMEYVEGKSLAQLVKERGPLPVAEACDYIRQAALGLQHAHERGMVHRDVKPHNLILATSPSASAPAASPVASAPGVVKVLDFGLAALTAERGGDLTEANAIMGTPDYMSPEQAEDARTADIRADIYSLGCTLYFLLTGKVPYPADTTIAKILAHREQPLPSIRQARPDVPAELARVLALLLAKNPADRYQTPAEVAAALAPFAAGTLRPPAKRGWRAAAAAFFFALIVVVAGIVVYRIQTDRGELIITTESDDVEVIVKQGGNLIEIMDGKTKKRITLRSGVYDLELKGDKGLKLDITKATLRRGETVLATIERLPKAAPPPALEAKPPVVSPQLEVVEIQLLQRVRIHGRWNFTSDAAVALGGKLFAADVMEGNKQVVVVWDGMTGKELYRVPGWMCRFTADGKTLFVHAPNPMLRTYRLYEAATGQELRSFTFNDALHGCDMLADSRYAMLATDGIVWNLCDLENNKILQSWRREQGSVRSWPSTVDGRFVFVWPAGEKSYIAWDVQKNQRSDEFAHIVKYDRIGAILPGNKQAVVGAPQVGQILIVDVADGKSVSLPVADMPEPVAHSVAQFEPLRALFGYKNGLLRQYRWRTDKVLAEFQLPDGEKLVRGMPISVSPDGRHACVETDRSVYLLRLAGPPPEVKVNPSLTPPQPVVTALQLVQRVAITERWGNFPSAFASSDGKVFAADVIEGKKEFVVVWDGKSGKELYRLPGWMCRLTADGSKLLLHSADIPSACSIHEAATGKLLHSFRFKSPLGSFAILPDSRHAVMYFRNGNALNVCDLEDGAILQTWPWDGRQAGPWTDDGRILMHRLPGASNYLVWDVQKNRPSPEMAHIAKFAHIHWFLPGNKQALVQAGQQGKGLIVDVADGKAVLVPDRTWPLRDPTWAIGVPGSNPLDPRINLDGSAGGRICTVDWYSGKVMADYQIPKGEKFAPNSSFNLSSNGRYATVQTDKAIYLLHLAGPTAK